MVELVEDPSLAPPMGPYCYAYRAGNLVFLGGTPGTTAEALMVDGIPKGKMAGETPGRADMAAQTVQSVEAIHHATQLAGGNWKNALRFNLFLEDWKEIDGFLRSYRSAIGVANPAETLIGYGLYQPSMIMEIDGIISLSEIKPLGGPGYGAHPYLPPHAGRQAGDLICLSAVLPIDNDGKLIGRGSAQAQTRQIMTNLGTILHGIGANVKDVVRYRVFISDLRHYDDVVKEMTAAAGEEALRAIVVAGIPVEGALVMIEPTAWLGKKEYFSGPGNARAVRIGDVVFTNGILPLENNEVLFLDEAAKQTKNVLGNLSKVLGAAGCGIEDVCQSQVTISDFRDYDDYNGVYTGFFKFPYAARHTVRAGLGGPSHTGLRYQIEATAILNASKTGKVVTAKDNFYHRRVALGRRA